ncbi:MAG: response regulator transcription factor [Planctomycetes bacterium]|nr:response regulator transcription factor [Planctomycetota bacterium]
MASEAPTSGARTNNLPLVRVVDDEESIQALFQSLAPVGGFEVVSYRTARSFLDRVENDDRPGCLVLDLMLGDSTGIDVLKEMAARHDPLPVVFMSGLACVSQAVVALKLGSLDFVEKPFDIQTMLAAIRRAIDCDIAQRSAEKELARLQRNFARLTARETEVMDLIVQGCANKEVAARLDLSPKTIEVHRANVMRKTEAASLAELVRMHVAVRTGAERTELVPTH